MHFGDSFCVHCFPQYFRLVLFRFHRPYATAKPQNSYLKASECRNCHLRLMTPNSTTLSSLFTLSPSTRSACVYLCALSESIRSSNWFRRRRHLCLSNPSIHSVGRHIATTQRPTTNSTMTALTNVAINNTNVCAPHKHVAIQWATHENTLK